MGKIYISSTLSDLAEHRAAVKSVIPTLSSEKDLMSFEYIGFEYRTTESMPAIDSYFAAIDEADFVIFLLGWRYGFIPDGSKKSVLELEYEHAMQKKKIILCYIINENYPVSPRLIEHGTGAEHLKRFKERLRKQHVISTFTSPEDLARKVAVDLTRFYKTTMAEAMGNVIAYPRLQAQLRKCEDNNRLYKDNIDSLRRRIENVVPAEPIWTTRNFKTDSSLCFVLMPFADEFFQVYEQAISSAAQNAGLRCMHAGEIFDNREIIEDIWESICTAQVIIADVTHRNPNVFYELGVCHTLGKEVIIITQNNEDVPFDIRHRRYIDYSPEAMTTFRAGLEKTIKNVVVRISKNGKPEKA